MIVTQMVILSLWEGTLFKDPMARVSSCRSVSSIVRHRSRGSFKRSVSDETRSLRTKD